MESQKNNKEVNGKYLGRFVLQMLGAPKDHVKKTMEDYVNRLKEDNDMEFIKEYIAEPKEEEHGFSTYAELEISFKKLEKFFAFCIDAMPASVDIIEPTEIYLNGGEFNSIMNDLQAKLHEVDYTIKNVRVQNKTLEKNATSILQNFLSWCTKETAKTPEQLKMETGVDEKTLKQFLDKLVKENVFEIIDDRWYKIKK